MCGRFVLDIPAEQLQNMFRLSSLPESAARYNIAPSQPVAVIRQRPGGERVLSHLKWGLVPSWAKDSSVGYKMINARSETVDQKPSFRQAFRSRRCLVPASGFYEWHKQGKNKIPHYFHGPKGAVLSLAGLWERWTAPTGEVLETCTILTTTANRLVKQYHDRMPVILPPQTWDVWLDGNIDDTSGLKELLLPCPADVLEEYAVSQDVNSPRNDHPGCIVPVAG